MDNVFEILIYLIIIISFLSSFFKKKKQQQRSPTRQPKTDEHYQAEVAVPQTQSKEEYNILKEFEDFFKVGDEPIVWEVPAQQHQPEKVATDEEHTRGEIWQEKTNSEHSVDIWERKKEEVTKRLTSIDSDIEKRAALFEDSLERKEQVYSDIARSVRTKFKNPATLKEYIVFSEILGKPKALRR
jgi:hypothetical protein